MCSRRQAGGLPSSVTTASCSRREAPGRHVSGATNQIVRPPDGTYRACQLARVHVVASWNSRMPPSSASRAAIAKEKEEPRRNEEETVSRGRP